MQFILLFQVPPERAPGSGQTEAMTDVFSEILTSNQGTSRFMIQGDIAVQKNRNALRCPGKSCLWPRTGNGLVLVPYTLSNNYTSTEKDIIRAAMEEVMGLTCIRFVARNHEYDYLRICPYDGCWSYIGRIRGTQDVSLMKTGCLHHGVIQHELLHSLGFQHEQCRSDRDNYIHINWDNISQDKERNFLKMNTQNLGTPYDYLSVMHYGKFAFATNSGKPTLEPKRNPTAMIGQRVGLSSLDVEKINRLYHCSVCGYLLADRRGDFSWNSRLHPNKSNCVLLIRVPEGKVFLQFHLFSFPPSPACVHGSVTVYDGRSRESPVLIPKICGKAQPPGIVASGNMVRVEVATGALGTNFRVLYISVKCGGSFFEPSGNFSTPNFPAKYPNSTDCVWTILAPTGYKIVLSIAQFDLEASRGCSDDYLVLRDSGRLQKKCGVIPLLNYTSHGRSLTLYFHSDVSVQAGGFRASYYFTP
ncbi:high choriolytic enzyme 1 isoform X2 [Xenopus laevis]|uniref:Metalloendopeptidase n=1 Tax=Xenopus laevis TaxID=8355 RepID=A0A8J1MVE3_XENLA|nr:high choriolytic enzyme 1 isoform X2 [Xenopus laevis]